MSNEQKLREALQELHDVFCEDDHSKAGRHRARLALIQTRQALATTEPAVNQQLTTEPVDEREAFEREMSKPPFEFCMDRWPDDGAYAWPGNYAAYHTQCAWVAWQARAAMAQGVKG